MRSFADADRRVERALGHRDVVGVYGFTRDVQVRALVRLCITDAPAQNSLSPAGREPG
jgi:hypothetical protein